MFKVGYGFDYDSMRALVAVSDKKLGAFVWHYLKDKAAGSVLLVNNEQDARRRMRVIGFSHFFVDSAFGNKGGNDFCKHIRSSKGANSEAPVFLLMPNPNKAEVLKARDCGVNDILGLPLSGAQVHSRLVRLEADSRMFIRSDVYKGPCRRRISRRSPVGYERRRDHFKGTSQALFNGNVQRQMA